jgi:hypothetical protein
LVKRFAIKSDRSGYAVYDSLTGLPAMIGTAPQDGLTLDEAEMTAEILNRAHRAASNSQES